MHLSEIWLYPIKACRGIRVPSAEASARGFRHDRRWMLVDSNGKFISQRQRSQLARVDVAFDKEGYRLSVGEDRVWVPETAEGDRSAVTVWSSTVDAVTHREGSEFFSAFLGEPARLVGMPADVVRPTSRGGEVGFADGYPYLLVGEASLSDLNARLDQPLPMARFRPNLVVHGSAAFDEDAWGEIRIGDGSFRNVKRCDRCSVTTIDATGAKHVEPLRTLATYRKSEGKVWFGVNLLPTFAGSLTIRVDDTVEA